MKVHDLPVYCLSLKFTSIVVYCRSVVVQLRNKFFILAFNFDSFRVKENGFGKIFISVCIIASFIENLCFFYNENDAPEYVSQCPIKSD